MVETTLHLLSEIMSEHSKLDEDRGVFQASLEVLRRFSELHTLALVVGRSWLTCRLKILPHSCVYGRAGLEGPTRLLA